MPNPATNPPIPGGFVVLPYVQPTAVVTTTGAVRITRHQVDLHAGDSGDEMTLLPAGQTSMPELPFGMSHSTQHPEVSLCALGNGWKLLLMAAAQLYA